jgi:hypothetical protein
MHRNRHADIRPIHQRVDADQTTLSVHHWSAGMAGAQVQAGCEPLTAIAAQIAYLRAYANHGTDSSASMNSPGEAKRPNKLSWL